MLDFFFRGLFDTTLTDTIAPREFLLCIGVSLVLGLLLCAMTGWRSRSSRSLTITLALLPAVVCVVIMMVNGNVGTGVAVAGAFSLVRFRSAPGTAREISAIFVAMGTGLITGMGYLDYVGVFEPVLDQFTRQYSLTQVKTTNMGSLFKLTYDVTMKDPSQEKKFIDQLRLRNGNLEIALGHQDSTAAAL